MAVLRFKYWKKEIALPATPVPYSVYIVEDGPTFKMYPVNKQGQYLEAIVSNVGVETVSGDGVDNTDSSNPVISYPNADQVDDSTTINKFVNQGLIDAINTAFGWGDHAGLYLPAGTQLAQSKLSISSQFLNSYDAVTGLFTSAQPLFSDIASTPTTLAGYGITDVYTQTETDNFFSGVTPIIGYNNNDWDTAFGWGDHSLEGYLTETNLTYTPSPTQGTVNSDAGTDAVIPTVDFTNAGLLLPKEKQALYNNSSTGITKFEGLSINVDTTKYDVGLIEGWFVDNTTDPNAPTKVFKSFPATTANIVTNIGTQIVTYIAIDVNGVHQQSAVPFQPEIQRDWIPLGVVVHSNKVNINAINNQPVVAIDVNGQLSDLVESIGFFNIFGNIFTANGANLNINKSAGHVFKQGSNFLNNQKDPHTLSLLSLIAPSNIRYRTQTGIESADTALVDPNSYDLNGVVTAVGTNKWTVQRIYVFQSNLVRIQYGQDIHVNKAEAIQSITTSPFVVEQNILENGLFRGLLVVKEGTIDLSNPLNTLFIEASKFGSVAGLGSLSTTSLQNAYDNSIQPEISTNSILGAVTVKRGSASDTDNVLEVQNGVGTTTFEITGEGNITANSFIKSGGLPTEFLKADGSIDSNTYLTSVENIESFKETVSTGIVSGGELSINVDTTKFDIAAGRGFIVDNTVYPAIVTEVNFGPFTAQTLTNLATSFATDVAIDINGNIVQQNSFTDIERRSLIFLGGFDHSNQTSILSTFSIQVPMTAPANSIQELARAVGDINLNGNVYGPNGANLNIDKSPGLVFSYGRNTVNDKTSPHKITTVSQTVISFGYVFNDGAGNGSFTTPVTVIDPNNYDNGTGTLVSVPVNNWAIQRLLFFPNDNKTFVQYGTATYNKKEDALNAVPRAVFEPLSGITTAMVRGYLIVREGETDLSSIDTEFLSADRFGIVSGLDGGGSLVAWGNIIGTLSDQLDLQSEFDTKLDSSSYTAADVLAKLLTVDGAGSGLDADLFDGLGSDGFFRIMSNNIYNKSSGITSFRNTAGQVINSNASNLAPLEVFQATSGKDTFMQFHISGSYGVYFGLDGATNDLFFGGWSAGAVKHKVWHAGNDGTGSGLDADLLDGVSWGNVNTNILTSGKVTSAVTNNGVYTVATLPAGIKGDRTFVSDATVTTFNSSVVGGGEEDVPVFYDGINWRIG